MKKISALLLSCVMMATVSACGAQPATNTGASASDKPAASVSASASESASAEASATPEATKSLVVYCPHPLEFIDPIVTEYEKATGVTVEVVAAGTGELLKRVEAEAGNPLGDIFWGGSLSTMEPKKDLFEPFLSENEDAVIPECKNADGNITRFTYIPSVLMINNNLIGDIKVEGYEDLLNPALKGKIAFADPSKSSSSFEHIVNILNAMGNGNPENGWDYMTKLVANLDGKLLSGSSAVYKGVADGEYTVGLTFEEGAAKYVSTGAPVSIVYMKEGVISRPDCIQIVKGAKNMANAKDFVNFCTSRDIQKLIAETLNRRSVRSDVLPAIGLKPLNEINNLKDDAQLAADNKQAWLDHFKEIFTSN